MPSNRPTTGAFLALTAAGLFGVSGAVAGGVFDTVDPAHVAQARSLIAAVLIGAYAATRGLLFPVTRWGRLVVLGINLALVNVTFYWAIDRLGVGPGATIQFLAATLILVWLALVRREHVRTAAWVAAIGSVLGVGLVTQAWSMEGSDVIGLAAGLVSAVLFAAYLVYGEHLGKDHRPAHVGAWGFIFASVFWACVLPWWTFPFEDASQVWLDLIIVGVVGTAAPFLLEFAALRLAPSSLVGIVATAEPAIAAVAAVIILDQTLDPVQWFGIGVVIVAIAAVQRWGIADAPVPAPVT